MIQKEQKKQHSGEVEATLHPPHKHLTSIVMLLLNLGFYFILEKNILKITIDSLKFKTSLAHFINISNGKINI